MAYTCAKNTTICTWCVSSEATDCMKELRISEWHSDNVLNMISLVYENTTYSFIHPLSQSNTDRPGEAAFFSYFARCLAKIIWLNYIFVLITFWSKFEKNPHVNCSCWIDPYKTWAYSHRYSYCFDNCVRKSRKFVFTNMINYLQPHFEHKLCILLEKLC